MKRPTTFLAALCALLLALCAAPTLAQIADIGSAINKAGRQRMLSQRMAKAYLQIGQEIDSEKSKRILDASIALFDRQHVELKNFAPTPEIRGTYLALERSWLSYKDVLVGARPSREGARKVLEISEEVLGLAHQGTLQLEKHSGTTEARLINIAGRQRMLSQRMAKFYQAMGWNVAPAKGAEELDRARREFVAGLQEMSGAGINTAAIKEELELGKQQWMFFENALARSAGDRQTAALHVATTSERLLEVMNTITGLYENLPAKR